MTSRILTNKVEILTWTAGRLTRPSSPKSNSLTLSVSSDDMTSTAVTACLHVPTGPSEIRSFGLRSDFWSTIWLFHQSGTSMCKKVTETMLLSAFLNST